MKPIPKAIPELDGGLFLPRQVVDLLEVVLDDHRRILQDGGSAEYKLVLDQLHVLLRMTGSRPALRPAREQLGLADPRQEMMGKNLLRC